MKRDNKDKDPDAKPQEADPKPERSGRSKDSSGNPPGETVGTETPGKKGNEEMSVAAERKARRDGPAPEKK